MIDTYAADAHLTYQGRNNRCFNPASLYWAVGSYRLLSLEVKHPN